jgi:hypothetical protein
VAGVERRDPDVERRLESFQRRSFAVAITLLVLDLHVCAAPRRLVAALARKRRPPRELRRGRSDDRHRARLHPPFSVDGAAIALECKQSAKTASARAAREKE